MTHDQLRAVSLAPVGSRVWFEPYKRPFTVRARSERFIVCTRPFFKKWLYTVIDLKEMIRGAENLVFGRGVKTDTQCQNMVDRLTRGESEISYRRYVPLDVVKVESAREHV